MASSEAWEVLSQRTLIERHWLRVIEQRVRLPNGHEIPEFHRIEGPDWAAVLALTDDGSAVLVRQYRHGAAESGLELPAGAIEVGEEGLPAAQRELAEETGFVAPDWQPLAIVNAEPARHTTRAHLFVARGARRAGPPRMEAGEHLTVEVIPARELGRRIDQREINHGVHVGAILLAARRGFFSID
jgi:8-oxo-dGTP pyrophosphatase MutT (NUDIX family)